MASFASILLLGLPLSLACTATANSACGESKRASDGDRGIGTHPQAPAAGSPFVNELHYDNAGVDVGEFVEVAGPRGTDLSAYQIVFYGGSSGAPYATLDLSGKLPDEGSGFGAAAFELAGIQNGSPDGLALVGPGGVVQFLSYEGAFVAVGGPADGVVSSDLGAHQDPSTPIGQSLQLTGAGSCYETFVWKVAAPSTLGRLNASQTFAGDPLPSPPEPAPGRCGEAATAIHDVQGGAAESPLVGSLVSVEAVVVGDFQGQNELRGFFLQEEDGDADSDPATSEGIFVFQGGGGVEVEPGDLVRVRGTVVESFGLTQLSDVSVRVCAVASPPQVSDVTLTLPVAAPDDLEAWEGMRVRFDQALYATDTFTLARFGEVTLSAGARPFQPTQWVAPGAAARAQRALHDRSRIQLDDGSNLQNPSVVPYLGSSGTLRLGDSVTGLRGVLSYAFGNYEVHPTQRVSFERLNRRQPLPRDPGGDLKVASLNVHNYFTTLDDAASPGCGPRASLSCRGADTSAELERQRSKLAAALVAMNADVVGVMEIENGSNAAMIDLANAANRALGVGAYEFVDTGALGRDAIRVGLLYKPSAVTPVGDFAVLDSSVDEDFVDTLNRPALAQTFEQRGSGERLTIAVNHLKSKGSPCDGDPDVGDGQGHCNRTRTAAAEAEIAWLEGDPTGSGDPDFLVLGDLNAYAMEDPITAFTQAGYSNLMEEFVGSRAYSFAFLGLAGYLDHALATPSLRAQVVAVTEWHVNADEPVALDYNQEFNAPGLFASDAFRSSDHDPIIVHLRMLAVD